MGKKKWICCGKEFAGMNLLTEHLESVHGMNRHRYRVSGLVGEQGPEPFPPVIVKATCGATAKLEAAFQVGGYWTDDTVAERVTEEEIDGTQAVFPAH